VGDELGGVEWRLEHAEEGCRVGGWEDRREDAVR